MSKLISAWVPGSDRDPAVVIRREDDGQVSIGMLSDTGEPVQLSIPPDVWFRMARQIFESRSRLSMTVECGLLN